TRAPRCALRQAQGEDHRAEPGRRLVPRLPFRLARPSHRQAEDRDARTQGLRELERRNRGAEVAARRRRATGDGAREDRLRDLTSAARRREADCRARGERRWRGTGHVEDDYAVAMIAGDELLRELVEIESPSLSPGARAVSERLARELETAGGTVTLFNGGHLRAELPGRGGAPRLLAVRVGPDLRGAARAERPQP